MCGTAMCDTTVFKWLGESPAASYSDLKLKNKAAPVSVSDAAACNSVFFLFRP
jgi:hypothetical protein